MKLLVIGGTGMIGHRMWASLRSLGHDVYSICRSDLESEMRGINGLDWSKCSKAIDVLELDNLERLVSKIKPDIALNCAGIVKQHELSKSEEDTISLNSLFPHQLSRICKEHGSRLIQFSTDCVYSGLKGYYTEEDIPDAVDLYGRSKILGEVSEQEHVITIRTSTIGREIVPHGGLVEWFYSQRGKTVEGFAGAIYSGFPTHTLAKILSEYIFPNSKLAGLYHISSEPIDKYKLLGMVKEVLEVEVEIKKNEEVSIKRDLDSSLFRSLTDMPIMRWEDIVNDLKIDFDFYNSLRV